MTLGYGSFSIMGFAKRRWHFFAAAAFALVHILLALAFVRVSSPTGDEPIHLEGGLEIVLAGRHTQNPESGVFPQVWCALPCVFGDSAWRGGGDGFHIDYSKPGWAGMFLRGRLMTLLLSVCCAFCIFAMAGRVFGRTSALLSLALYCLWPVFISNGALVTADMAATLWFFMSCAAFWLLGRRVGVSNLLFAAVSLSLLFLSKMSAPLILPPLGLWAASRMLSKEPLKVSIPFCAFAKLEGRGLKACALAMALIVSGIAVWAAIWIAYGTAGYEGGVSGKRVEDLKISGLPADCAMTALKMKLLPEAYVAGFLYMYVHSRERWSFLNGEASMHGRSMFFPWVFALKTPPSIIISFAIGVAALILALKRRLGRARAFALLLFLAFAATYLAAALSGDLNIGYRHLMPVFPPLLLVCACGFRELWRRRGLTRAIPFLLVLWCGGEAVKASPFQLAYFSPFFGGAEGGSSYLVDSSLDWGQDLKNVKGELERHGVATDGSQSIYLAYFGAVPVQLCGFEPSLVLFGDQVPLKDSMYEFKGGVYCISATAFRGLWQGWPVFRQAGDPDYLRALRGEFYRIFDMYKSGALDGTPEATLKDWAKACHDFQLIRFEILRRSLQDCPHDFSAGHSILVFKLTDDEVGRLIGEDFFIGKRDAPLEAPASLSR